AVDVTSFGQLGLSSDGELAAYRLRARARLSSADGQGVTSRRHDDIPGWRDHAEFARFEVERDSLACARNEMNAAETAQCAQRRAGHIGKLEVELHDF